MSFGSNPVNHDRAFIGAVTADAHPSGRPDSTWRPTAGRCDWGVVARGRRGVGPWCGWPPGGSRVGRRVWLWHRGEHAQALGDARDAPIHAAHFAPAIRDHSVEWLRGPYPPLTRPGGR